MVPVDEMFSAGRTAEELFLENVVRTSPSFADEDGRVMGRVQVVLVCAYA